MVENNGANPPDRVCFEMVQKPFSKHPSLDPVDLDL